MSAPKEPTGFDPGVGLNLSSVRRWREDVERFFSGDWQQLAEITRKLEQSAVAPPRKSLFDSWMDELPLPEPTIDEPVASAEHSPLSLSSSCIDLNFLLDQPVEATNEVAVTVDDSTADEDCAAAEQPAAPPEKSRLERLMSEIEARVNSPRTTQQ
ncbi:MAG: hypothetical protein KDA58_07110 [Planctomycetaceae bacterium]|nr:hypothetical protein [Planctomycetaceae bacterium]